MSDNNSLGEIEKRVQAGRVFADPPLEEWDPPLSGDIDIVIHADGSWSHEGRPFERGEIVELFSRILRRESDGHYYLVTPVEKWRIRVEAHALLVLDISRDPESGKLLAHCNHGPDLVIGAEFPLRASSDSDVPWLRCRHGLSAALTRSVWYRLADSAVDEAGQWVVHSGDWTYALGPLLDD
jgi:hypothetical protein